MSILRAMAVNEALCLSLGDLCFVVLSAVEACCGAGLVVWEEALAAEMLAFMLLWMLAASNGAPTSSGVVRRARECCELAAEETVSPPGE